MFESSRIQEFQEQYKYLKAEIDSISSELKSSGDQYKNLKAEVESISSTYIYIYIYINRKI